MNCEVSYVDMSMRLRYKHLNINGENFIIDMDRSFWLLLFPLFCWSVPHTIFKLEDGELLKQIKSSQTKKTNIGSVGLLITGISVLVAQFLTPFVDYFNISMPISITLLSLLFPIGLVILFRLYLSKTNQIKLEDIVKLDKLQTKRIRIGPKNFKHILFFLVFYFMFLLFAVGTRWAFIEINNLFFLLTSMVLIFFLMIGNAIALMPGHTKVKLK